MTEGILSRLTAYIWQKLPFGNPIPENEIFWAKDDQQAKYWREAFRQEGRTYLQTMREQREMSHDTLAEICEDVDTEVLKRIEGGEYMPSPQQLFTLADMLGIGKRELMEKFYGPPLEIHVTVADGFPEEVAQQCTERFYQALEEEGAVVIRAEDRSKPNSNS